MDVMEAIRTRKSVRSFRDTPVEREKIEQILEAARISPSARNEQNWHFIVVTDKEKLMLLYEAAFQKETIKEAPCAIVVCGTKQRIMDCGQPTNTVNPTIATAYMILVAHTLGLGTCWLGHFKADEVKAAIGIPEDVEVVTFFPLGYSNETPEERPRRELSEVASSEIYNNPWKHGNK